MANLQRLLPIFAAVCLLAGAAIAADVEFQVEGRVYCDNCRAGFITNITEYIEGATVRLQCTHFPDDKVEHSVEAVTGAGGYYTIVVPNDHEEEVCYVQLVKSPRADCGEIGDVEGEKARILLTENSGQADHRRYANSLGFLKDTALPVCPELLKAYALDEEY
ncbi:Pollen-specific protein C13 [Platanthera zijinensis]|uniref:Pollen-specific protein C13 n=1 Tax=Platanthera zijinensis TaxID=2320716 RepID=A0AAP0G9N7_9ASPA